MHLTDFNPFTSKSFVKNHISRQQLTFSVLQLKQFDAKLPEMHSNVSDSFIRLQKNSG